MKQPGREWIRIPVAGKPLNPPSVPCPSIPAAPPLQKNPPIRQTAAAEDGIADLVHRLAAVSETTARVHKTFLQKSSEMTRAFGESLRLQSRLFEAAGLPAADSPGLPGMVPPP